MSDSKWNDVKLLFHEAIDLNPKERKIFLSQNCQDKDLLREVEELLISSEASGDFIADSAVIEAGLFASNKSRIGEQIGNYEIVREIGRGGMGAVYLAVRADDEFSQQVALKIVKRGMDTDFIVNRFRNERQILASLNHPNIARLFEGGTTEDDLPYFVMEFVDGQDLFSYCNNENSTVEERLQIFRRVCSAVSYAHQNLIVHRDLKPSNILVTADGTPKLLDFGIAKILNLENEAENTKTTGIFRLLTPEYASPEQIRGEKITTVSDVYSLGVLLYQLLTGQSPYQTKSYDEIIHAVCDTDPIEPSSAISRWDLVEKTLENEKITTDVVGIDNPKSQIPNPKSLRGDLDNIIIKALKKEPERRYASVQEFSEDIRRHLVGLPVTAIADSTSYRVGKFVKRHRAGVFAGVLIFFTILSATAITGWQAFVAERERAKAERRFDDVRQLANTILFDHYERIKNLPGATEARAKLVSDAIIYLDKISSESGNNPDLQRELVGAYRKLGAIQGSTVEGGNLGQYVASRENYLKAVAIQENLAINNKATIDDQRTLGNLYLEVGLIFEKKDERPIQAEYVEKGLKTFQTLKSDNPNQLQGKADFARAMWHWAYIVRLKGDNQGAIKIYSQVAEIYEELGKGSELPQKYKRSAALTYKNIGSIYILENDFPKSLEFYQKAFVYDKENAEISTDNVESQMDLVFTHNCLGSAYFNLKEIEKAIAEYKISIPILEKLNSLDAKNRFIERTLFNGYSKLGELYRDNNEFSEAESYFQKCQKILNSKESKEVGTSEKTHIADYFWKYGELFLRKSDLEKNKSQKLNNLREAKVKLEEAERIYEALKSENILDPAYLENPAKIAESLNKVEREIELNSEK